MTNLQYRQQKIQEKRKQTPWREYLMEIVSRFPLLYYKNDKGVTVYSPKRQIKTLYSTDDVVPGVGINGTVSGFFQNLDKLFLESSFPNLHHFGSVINSNFSQYVINSKNTYLSNMVIANCEDVLYSFNIKDNSSLVLNSLNIVKNNNTIYTCKAVTESFNIFYSKNIHNSSDIRFSSNLVGCHFCIFCNDLNNLSYCINNTQYSKEVFEQESKKILINKAHREEKYEDIKPNALNINVENVTGDDIVNSGNVTDGYHILNLNNGRNVMFVGSEQQNEHMYDCFSNGRSEHFYAVPYGGTFSSHIYCSGYGINNSQNLFYCLRMDTCSFCLGCIGLKNKSYCILNKQYTKEERYEKVDKIFDQMEQEGTLGEFFPATMNPFYFNDTAAYLIDPSFTKEEVTAKGYIRRDDPIKVDIQGDAEVVSSSDLGQYEGYDDQGNWTITTEILKKVIQDEQGNYYRIIPMEYKFLIKHGLPLPRKHWLERMKENFRIN